MKVTREVRAISHVLSVLMMVAVTVVASLTVYNWVLGYVGFTTSKAGKAILIRLEIQGMTKSEDGKDLTVYVQNVGMGPVGLDQASCVYIDNILQTQDKVNIVGNNPLQEGDAVKITVIGAAEGKDTVKIKVVSLDGAFTEVTGTPSENP